MTFGSVYEGTTLLISSELDQPNEDRTGRFLPPLIGAAVLLTLAIGALVLIFRLPGETTEASTTSSRSEQRPELSELATLAPAVREDRITPEDPATEVADTEPVTSPTERTSAIPDLPQSPNSLLPEGDTIDTNTWTFTASADETNAENVTDGEFDTRWSSQTNQAPDQFLQIDFGTGRRFNLIALATGSEQLFEGPREYELYASNDPDDFGEPIAEGTGSSLTLIQFDTITARHIRIVQTGSDPLRSWSISELAIYRPGDADLAVGDASTDDQAAGTSPTSTSPTSTSSTSTTTTPTTTQPTTTLAPVSLQALETPSTTIAPTTTTTTAPTTTTTTTTTTTIAPTTSTTTTLPPRTTTTTRPPRTTTVAPSPIPDPSNWRFDASSTREDPENAVDGNIETRWSSRARQENGQFFQIDFGQRATFSNIVLALNENDQPQDYPRGYEVYAFNNPDRPGAPIARGSGQTLTTINFEPVTARYVRILQTGSDDFFWWSIYELDIN